MKTGPLSFIFGGGELAINDFEFTIGEKPNDVCIKIGDKLVPYKRCETPEIAKIIVDGQNSSRRIYDDN